TIHSSLVYPHAYEQIPARLTARLCHRIVCVSDAVARYAATTLSVPQRKITTIYNGIDTHRPERSDGRAAARALLGLALDAPAACFVGRLAPEKQPLLLVDVAAMLVSSLPDLRLFVIGGGPLE